MSYEQFLGVAVVVSLAWTAFEHVGYTGPTKFVAGQPTGAGSTFFMGMLICHLIYGVILFFTL